MESLIDAGENCEKKEEKDTVTAVGLPKIDLGEFRAAGPNFDHLFIRQARVKSIRAEKGQKAEMGLITYQLSHLRESERMEDLSIHQIVGAAKGDILPGTAYPGPLERQLQAQLEEFKL